MFIPNLRANCILREEDGYQCPGPSPDNCAKCSYHYQLGLGGYLFGIGIWFFIIIALIIALIITSPLWILGILFERT